MKTCHFFHVDANSDLPSLLWVQEVQLQPVRVQKNWENISNYLFSTEWILVLEKMLNVHLKALVFRYHISPTIRLFSFKSLNFFEKDNQTIESYCLTTALHQTEM